MAGGQVNMRPLDPLFWALAWGPLILGAGRALGQGEEDTLWQTPQKRMLGTELRGRGQVLGRSETTVYSAFTGKIIWLAPEGSVARAGEVVVRFDDTQARNECEEANGELYEKEDAVKEAREEIARTEERYRLEIAKAQAQLEMVELERSLVHGRPTAEERREVELAVEAAALRLKQADDDYAGHKELFRAGAITATVLRRKELAQARQKTELARARNVFQLTLAGATPEAKRLAARRVTEARMGLETAAFNREADLAIARAGLDLAALSLKNFRLNLERKKERIAAAEVKAPVGGRVVFPPVWKGSSKNMSPIRVGEDRNQGQDLCKIVDFSNLRAAILISEVDFGLLKEGLAAEVALEAFPGQAFNAKVSRWEPVAKDKNAALSPLALKHAGQAFVNVIEVTLEFEGLDEAAKAGLRVGYTAQARIWIEPPRPTLCLPWTAIRFDAQGKPFVRVRRGEAEPAERNLRLGRSDDFFVEILGGVEMEERVEGARKSGEGAGRW